MELTFEIQFHSDFHIGAGYGLGMHVDSALHRDADGVPVIRGSTLTGLLRESLADLLELDFLQEHRVHGINSNDASSGPPYCGQFAPEKTTDCPLCSIFGSPRTAKRWHISSARPVALEQPQSTRKTDKWEPGVTAAQITTRARVNPRTRRTEQGKLFTREDGDSALRFRFTVQSVSDDEQTLTEAAWFWAATRATRRIGANKGRGHGECSILLTEKLLNDACANRFAQILQLDTAKPTNLPVIQTTPHTQIEQALDVLKTKLTAPKDTPEYRVRVLLRTDEPLLLSRRAAAGNQFETLPLIRGSILRGVLGWHLFHRLGKKRFQEKQSAQIFQTLFFDGGLQFFSLSPAILNKDEDAVYPTIVAPRDLVTCETYKGYDKESGHGVWSMAWDDFQKDQCPRCQQTSRLKSISGFLPLDAAQLAAGFQPKRTNEMHIRIDPANGRVRSGDLYEYVALQAGQYFLGEIVCRNQAIWQAFCQVADLPQDGAKQLRLGKASRRGYGQCTIEFAGSRSLHSLWHGLPLLERIRQEDFNPVTDSWDLVITLLSDTIVLDSWGRCVRGFAQEWLEQELNPSEAQQKLNPSEARPVKIQVDDTRCFSEAQVVDGFNNQLGLPRNRDVALMAGSSARLSIRGIKDRQTLCTLLEKVEAQGIGVRRNEGFGLVAFNHPVYNEFKNLDASHHVNLSADMKLRIDLRDHVQQAMVSFKQSWGKQLDEQFVSQAKWLQFNKEPFEGVARILHTSELTGVKELEQLLDGLGNLHVLIREDMKGRDPKAFFQEEGKPGVTTIKRLVRELAEKIAKQQPDDQLKKRLWRTGLQMLAARVSEAAQRKAKQSGAIAD